MTTNCPQCGTQNAGPNVEGSCYCKNCYHVWDIPNAAKFDLAATENTPINGYAMNDGTVEYGFAAPLGSHEI